MRPSPASPARPGPLGLSPRWPLLTCLSLCLTALVPLSGRTPLGDLGGVFTDHVRQPYLAWLALHRGLSVYTLPLREAAAGLSYPQAISEWLDVPYVYPPGALGLFLPLAWVGRWVPMSQQAFGQLSLLYLLVLTHAVLLLVLRTLEELPGGGRAVVGVLASLVLLRLGLQGQYDGVWLGCGVMALRRLKQGAPASALRWVAAAALLHYRAVVLAAVGAVALWQAVRGRPLRQWPWATLLWVAAVGCVCVGTFVLMAPGAARGGADTPSLLGEPWAAAGVVLTSAGAALLAWRGADRMVAASVGVAGVLAFVDTRHWWHASLLLLVPLAVGVVRAPRHPALVRWGLVAWAVCLQVLAWGGNPLWLLRDLNRFARLFG